MLCWNSGLHRLGTSEERLLECLVHVARSFFGHARRIIGSEILDSMIGAVENVPWETV